MKKVTKGISIDNKIMTYTNIIEEKRIEKIQQIQKKKPKRKKPKWFPSTHLIDTVFTHERNGTTINHINHYCECVGSLSLTKFQC